MFAVEREQTSVAFHLNFTRQLRHRNHRVVIFDQWIIAGRADALAHPHVNFAI
jgi:hypothetical protein